MDPWELQMWDLLGLKGSEQRNLQTVVLLRCGGDVLMTESNLPRKDELENHLNTDD